MDFNFSTSKDDLNSDISSLGPFMKIFDNQPGNKENDQMKEETKTKFPIGSEWSKNDLIDFFKGLCAKLDLPSVSIRSPNSSEMERYLILKRSSKYIKELKAQL